MMDVFTPDRRPPARTPGAGGRRRGEARLERREIVREPRDQGQELGRLGVERHGNAAKRHQVVPGAIQTLVGRSARRRSPPRARGGHARGVTAVGIGQERCRAGRFASRSRASTLGADRGPCARRPGPGACDRRCGFRSPRRGSAASAATSSQVSSADQSSVSFAASSERPAAVSQSRINRRSGGANSRSAPRRVLQRMAQLGERARPARAAGRSGQRCARPRPPHRARSSPGDAGGHSPGDRTRRAMRCVILPDEMKIAHGRGRTPSDGQRVGQVVAIAVVEGEDEAVRPAGDAGPRSCPPRPSARRSDSGATARPGTARGAHATDAGGEASRSGRSSPSMTPCNIRMVTSAGDGTARERSCRSPQQPQDHAIEEPLHDGRTRAPGAERTPSSAAGRPPCRRRRCREHGQGEEQ